jgi:hypothetical protein
VLTTGTLDSPSPLPEPPAAAVSGTRSDPPPWAPPGSALLRRLGKLDEALLDGRITPGEYHEMRFRAEQELGDARPDPGQEA